MCIRDRGRHDRVHRPRGPRHAAEHSRRRRRADGRAVLPDRGDHDAVRAWSRYGFALTHRPAILWLGALLASLLALDRLFATDHDDGSLDLLMMGSMPLELAVAAKAIAHWLTTGLPLVLITPVLGLMLNVELGAMGWVSLTLLAGTPALTFIGLIGAALSVALRRGGLLLAVLVLPLTIPVLIFGVAAANAAIVGPAPFGPPFTILCALSLASLVLGPVAAAAALRHGLE